MAAAATALCPARGSTAQVQAFKLFAVVQIALASGMAKIGCKPRLT
jgi:hypothetical protein